MKMGWISQIYMEDKPLIVCLLCFTLCSCWPFYGTTWHHYWFHLSNHYVGQTWPLHSVGCDLYQPKKLSQNICYKWPGLKPFSVVKVNILLIKYKRLKIRVSLSASIVTFWWWSILFPIFPKVAYFGHQGWKNWYFGHFWTDLGHIGAFTDWK